MASTTLAAGSSDQLAAMMSRPQIGIDRLPVRRMSNEPKEAMNCKSCRKRKVRFAGHECARGLLSLTIGAKIKCNRLKPSCEACQIFNCACVYDAIPKKRGPKTDVLEALLKRVNGLEKRLKDEKNTDSPDAAEAAEVASTARAIKERQDSMAEEHDSQQDNAVEASPSEEQPAPLPPQQPRQHQRQPSIQHQQRPLQLAPAQQPMPHMQEADIFTSALLDTFFARLHGKPYYVLDEPATRQRLRDNHLPRFLVYAIYAVSVRHVPHLCGGHTAAVNYSQEYTRQSRAEIDVDEPSIEHLQALILLAMASFQSGRGKKSYMLLSHAISMAFALSLHRELPRQLRIGTLEREGRRKLFWTCYLMDRFTVAGSKRPSLILDDSISLKMPAWMPLGSQMWIDGNLFPNGTSNPYAAGAPMASQGSGAMLVEIVRVLGVTNRYLAAGGVKGDSHFPWHAQSTLSRIRADLDHWTANTQDAFTSVEALFSQSDSTTLVLSKLVYHLVHCLIYRPFLPVDLAELTGSGQHQSWQIEATNLCFLHANAITELVEIGRNTAITDWPAFVGYCICTAGTVHVHGAHYMAIPDGDVFSHSADFLTREMAQLNELRFTWAGVHHQKETLQNVYASHSQLVKSLANSPMRFSPVFQMEDFFDRYPGSYIDGAHMTFADVDVEVVQQESMASWNGFSDGSLEHWSNQPVQDTNAGFQATMPSHYMTQNPMPPVARRAKRRRTTNGSLPYPTPNSQAPVPNNHALERQISHDDYTVRQPSQLPPQPVQLESNHPPPPEHNNNNLLGVEDQTFTQSALSPSFNFGPLLQQNETLQCDPFQNLEQQTPSVSADSAHTESLGGDPFLTLLEQLAQNDGSSGEHDLDFFLNEQG